MKKRIQLIELSIIVPVYNGEKSIAFCLDSILMQDYINYEVIVIDDGSVDKTELILMEYCKKHSKIKYIKKSNGGVSSARNVGIEQSQGEHLLFIDSDDLLVGNEFISNIMKNKEYDYVVAGLCHRFQINNKAVNERYQFLPKSEGVYVNELPEEFFVNGYIHTSCSKLYKSMIIKKHKVNFPNLRLSEDSNFNLDYIKYIKNWAIIPDTGYCYVHSTSIDNATSKYFESDQDIYISLFYKLKELPLSNSVVKKTIYPQFMAICSRIINQKELSVTEKITILKRFVKRKPVKKILLTTHVLLVEKITGLLYCTGNLFLIQAWKDFLSRV